MFKSALGSSTSSAADTIKGNNTSTPGTSQDLTPSQVRGMLAVKPLAQMVATRCGINSGGASFSSAQPGVASRIQHYLPYGAKSLWPIYSAFYCYISPVTSLIVDLKTQGGYGYYATSATVVAAGSGYAVGDTINVTGVPTNQFPPMVQVDAVSSGSVTALSVVGPGGFGSLANATGTFSTTAFTGSGTGLTVTIGVNSCAFVMQAAIEQTWGTQSAKTYSNLGGVMPLYNGIDGTLCEQNIVMPFGEPVVCLPVDVGLAAGSTIGTRIYTPGTQFQGGRYLSGSTGLNEVVTTNTSLAANTPSGGTYTTNSNPNVGGYNGFQPIAIMGIPQTPGPTFGIIGDSIGHGTVSNLNAANGQDTGDANCNCGYLERAINQTCPFTNFSQGSDKMSNWMTPASASIRLALLNMLNLSHVVDELNINDLYAGTINYTLFKSMKIKFWSMLMGFGIKEIWCTTCTPYTTSTQGVSAVPTIAAGGTGYAANSTFNVTISGGTQSLGAAVISVSTNGSGVVNAVNSVVNIGYYSANPSTPNSPTGGTGTGLSLNLQFSGWLDATSQSTTTASGVITSYNADLRAGTFAQYGVARVLDLSPVVETSTGSGIWVPGGAYDGLHPAQTLVASIASQISSAFPLATL